MKRVVQIKDIGRILTGNTPSTSDAGNYNSNDILFVKPSDISDSGITKLTTAGNYISNHARKKARIAPKGSVITTCIGIIGKTAILEKECAFNQQINAIIPDETLVLSPYLAYAIYAQKKYMQGKANAAVVPIINKTDFGEIQIVLHDLSTQKGIITKLKRLDYFIRHSNTILAKLDTLVKSRFIEMFGDPVTNPMGWETLSWQDVFETTTGKLDSNAAVEGGQYPFFTCAKEPFAIDTYAFDCEALLLAGNNAAGVYDVKHYSGKFNAYQRTYVLRLKHDKWKYELFKHQLEGRLAYLQSQSIGSNTKYLTLGILHRLKFIVPPLTLQNQFADFVAQADKSKLAIHKLLEKQELLRTALMQEYFEY